MSARIEKYEWFGVRKGGGHLPQRSRNGVLLVGVHLASRHANFVNLCNSCKRN